MVIPLTPEALILREKKNKRKTMMNDIKNTMCRLRDLTQEQIDSLREEMPSGQFDFRANEPYIGVTKGGCWGTWAGAHHPTIVTYTEMMQLLGKDMNKQTAQEQIAVMQIEMDKLKAIINKPEVKTGRVMNEEDLERNTLYYTALHTLVSPVCASDAHSVDSRRIATGTTFHDKETADKYFEYLKLEQELRRAQIADGGGWGRYVLVIDGGESICSIGSLYYEKISFSTQEARDKFRHTHTDEQLTLLIRGV
jgi:predicted phage tail protein